MYVFTCVCNWRYYQYSQRLSPLNVVSSNLVHDDVYSVQQYVIKFVSNLRQIFSTNKTNRHDITEILLKVELNTINKTKNTIHLLTNYMRYCTMIWLIYSGDNKKITYNLTLEINNNILTPTDRRNLCPK